MTLIGCWRFTGRLTQIGTMTMGKNETTPLRIFSLIRLSLGFVNPPRRESGSRGVVSLLPTVTTPSCVGVSVKRQQQISVIIESTLKIVLPDLTFQSRFNKICHPSQRPRWQVDKEAIGLSRVQQCSSTYSPPS